MGHNINKGMDGRDSMFYVESEGSAWHGLGTGVNQALTAREALHYANLDYKVVQKPILVDLPNGREVYKGKVANVRSDNNVVLGLVGTKYRILQNEDAFGFFDPLVGESEAMYHTAGVLGNGEVIWILAKLPEYIDGPDGNKIEQNIVIFNSHDGSKSLTAMFTPIRVVCENTLNMAIRHATNKVIIRHTGDVDQKLKEAHRILGLSVDYFKKVKPILNQLHDVPATEKDIEFVVNSLFPKNEKAKSTTRNDNLQAEFVNSVNNSKGQDIDHTLYWLYNGAVAYLDNDKTYRNDSTRLSLAWFNTNFKQKAFDLTSKLFTEKTGHELITTN